MPLTVCCAGERGSVPSIAAALPHPRPQWLLVACYMCSFITQQTLPAHAPQVLPAGERFAFEFRDASWFCREVYDVLARHNWCLAITVLTGADLGGVQAAARLPMRLRLHPSALCWVPLYMQCCTPNRALLPPSLICTYRPAPQPQVQGGQLDRQPDPGPKPAARAVPARVLRLGRVRAFPRQHGAGGAGEGGDLLCGPCTKLSVLPQGGPNLANLLGGRDVHAACPAGFHWRALLSSLPQYRGAYGAAEMAKWAGWAQKWAAQGRETWWVGQATRGQGWVYAARDASMGQWGSSPALQRLSEHALMPPSLRSTPRAGLHSTTTTWQQRAACRRLCWTAETWELRCAIASCGARAAVAGVLECSRVALLVQCIACPRSRAGIECPGAYCAAPMFCVSCHLRLIGIAVRSLCSVRHLLPTKPNDTSGMGASGHSGPLLLSCRELVVGSRVTFAACF